MIKVAKRPEYIGFNREVRNPGAAFLAATPRPTSDQFKSKNFWNRAAKELRAAYSGICAYTATYIADGGTVDHFLPKTLHPELAYEWDNFRLAHARVNNSKANIVGIADPFLIGDDWFELELPSCLIKAKAALDRTIRLHVNNTINCLRLNADDLYVQERCDILVSYARGEISFPFLERRYPFLAREIHRQGLEGRLSNLLIC